MNSSFPGLRPAFLTAVIGISICGCDSRNLSDVELPIPEATVQNPETATVKVASAEAVSPAVGTTVIPDSEASAEDVCRTFVELLNQEEIDNFELLLTATAMRLSHQLDFHLPPVFEPGSEFSLSQPRFGTSRMKLCYIDSKQTGAEQPAVTWMLRKTKAGWRIAGMLVENEGQHQNLLSFESAADLEHLKSSLTEQVSAAP